MKGMSLGTLKPIGSTQIGINSLKEAHTLLVDEGFPLEEGEDVGHSPLLAEVQGEGEEEYKIFESWENQISQSLEALENQGLRSKALEMLRRHQDMWSGHLGEVTATQHRIDLKPDTRPSRQAPYRAGHSSRILIKKEIERMQSEGVIEPAMSEWASPVVIVPKNDGSARFCVDYRKLNASTIRDAYPIPRMDDCIDSLGEAKIFTTLDCNSGYWQIPIKESDRHKTAFVSHMGSYHFKRMPFGLTNAPATFQRAIDILLSGVNWQFCLVYLDDVIVYSNTEEDHIRHVDEVLTVLGKAGLSLKFAKSHFFRRSVNYLGHRITPGQLKVDLKRRDALEGFQFPRTQTQVRSFLGMCNVFRRFVKDFAKIAGPLNELLKKGMPVDLEPPTDQQIEAFHELKRRLLEPPILRLPVYDRPYTVDVDASKDQLGCVLLQEQADGELMPVGYWRRTLLPAELNYSTTERECLAVVWAVLLLRPYLERTRFTARTDHHALKWALFLANAEGRLAKWRLRLAEFDFEVVYRPGVKHSVPDALSRVDTAKPDQGEIDDQIPCLAVSIQGFDDWGDIGDDWLELQAHEPDVQVLTATHQVGSEPILPEEWVREQESDPLCKQIAAELERKTKSRFVRRKDGVIVRIAPLDESKQIVVPSALRRRVLLMNHEPGFSRGTLGGNEHTKRCVAGSIGLRWWPTCTIRYASVRHALRIG